MKKNSIKLKIFFGIIILSFSFTTKAQSDSINYEVEVLELNSTGTYSPFWMQSNNYGLILEQPHSIYFNLGLSKEMQHSQSLIDYGFKINASIQSDYKYIYILAHEYYANARLSVFGLSLGAKKEHYGNQDSTLSTGGFLFSKNARPMPKIWAGIENFTPIPFTKGYIEIKGGLSHGWFENNRYVDKALLHHKYAYLRLGGKLPVRIQYGLDHVAQWGGISPDYGIQPSGFTDFKRIFFAQEGSSAAVDIDQINTLGNHIISQSMKLELTLNEFDIDAYWQNLSEDGPIRPLWNSMNKSDGIWGVSLKNKQFTYIQGILYEYINTTDQSGPFHDKDGIVFGGDDSYFNNGIYKSGWSYHTRTIGTALILSPLYNSNGILQTNNNRIQAHHFGIEGRFGITNYRALATFNKSYGTYGLAIYPAKTLNSIFVELTRPIFNKTGIEAKLNLSADYGSFYGNTFGVLVGLRKRGNFINY
jgi:hypothetical protein